MSAILVNQKKLKAKKAKATDRAMPVIKKPKNTDTDKISLARSVTTTMKTSPQWGASPALQAAVTTWNAAADAIETNAKSIADARSNLAALEAAQRSHRQDWTYAIKQVTGSVAVVSQGSPDAVHALGFDVFSHVAAVPQTAAPSGLVTLPGAVPGEAATAWQRGTARHGFLVQRATDPANAATYSATVPSTKARYKSEGEKSSSVLSFRVAAIDPTTAAGIGPWSDWVACTVR